MMTNLKKKEIEVKFKVSNRENLEKRLKSLGAKQGTVTFHRTYSLFKPDFSFAKKGIYLRTREEGNKHTFTIKVKGAENPDYFERDEYEVEISDAKKVAEMLAILGFNNQRIFEKYRVDWIMPDQYKATVCIDEVATLGTFIEIEAPPVVIEQLISLLELKGERITVSYWTLYEKKTGSFEGNMVFKK